MPAPILHVVHRAIHAPETICGIDLGVMKLGFAVGAVMFALTESGLAGLVMGGVCGLLALWATRRDPQLLTIVWTSLQRHPRYDARTRQ